MCVIDLNSFPVKPVLKYLLQDKTTKENIIFATDTYTVDGCPVDQTEQITEDLLRRMGENPIQPRCAKSRQEQADRTRKNAEVFTPVWICNKMNNSLDTEWFGRENVFNTENDREWVPTEGRIDFPEGLTWQQYTDSTRLEITCGEAPFLVSRYDAADGSSIELSRRIGMLDRKMRIVNENTDNEEDWLKWTYRAFQSVYGYEYQGDNLLIARVNILMSFVDYMSKRLDREPTAAELRKMTNIICWNIWQMDGLTGMVPLRTRDAEVRQETLFGFAGIEPEEPVAQEGIPCRVFDWKGNKSAEYNSIKR